MIGQEITEQLDYFPARFIRQIIEQVKVRLKNAPTQPPILAPARTSPLQGALPSFYLVVDLIIENCKRYGLNLREYLVSMMKVGYRARGIIRS